MALRGSAESDRETARTPAGRHFQRDMEVLWSDVLRQSTLVEHALQASVRSFCEGRLDLAASVHEGELTINTGQVRIERECLKMLALHQPVATDLRRVAAILKINNELERMADLAEHIAKRGRKLVGKPIPMSLLEQVETLGAESLAQVRDSLDALARSDATLSRTVIDADKRIDVRGRTVVKELKQMLRSEPQRVNTWLRLINTARNLERIADHATNVAEEVIYVSEGQIYRRAEAPE